MVHVLGPLAQYPGRKILRDSVKFLDLAMVTVIAPAQALVDFSLLPALFADLLLAFFVLLANLAIAFATRQSVLLEHLLC